MLYVCYKKIDLKENFLGLAILIAYILIFFMPRMHDRYAYMIEILSVIYVIGYKRDYYLPIILQLSALSGYYAFLAPLKYDYQYMNIFSLLNLLSLVIFTISILRSNSNKKYLG